jgi:hypothetical protein
LSDKDRLLREILNNGENEHIDMLIKGLQCYVRSKPNLTYCRIGGAIAEKLTRMAFAVMVKFAGLSEDLERIVAEVEYSSVSLTLEEGPARDK